MYTLYYAFSNDSSGRPYCLESLTGVGTKDNACIAFDGSQIVFASEMERFSKKKHDVRVPLWSEYAMREHCVNNLGFKDIRKSKAIVKANHHLNHIYECFYQSGFHESAVIVNDGMGNLDDCITLAYMKEGSKPLILRKFPRRDSLCNLYARISGEIFKREHCEGKLMGLAPYGESLDSDFVTWDRNLREITIDENQLLTEINKFNSATEKNGNVMLTKNAAYTIQKNFEDVISEIMLYFYQLLESKDLKVNNLCLSGGGILNCPTNSKIVDLGLFEHYYASPQPCDGCAESIGRCFRDLEAQGFSLESRRLTTAYLGAIYEHDKLTRSYVNLNNPLSEIANRIRSGELVLWYQDGSEYGPRALGHRSFLADPTKKEMLDDINRIKGREWWRPLAPVVPEELFGRLFNDSNTDMCEFMLRTLSIKGKWKNKLNAVCHVDGTTRPQLLKKEVNPELYDLLMTYYAQTSIPCLINTSLNINGFPIVETPADFCDLIEEIGHIESARSIMPVFVERGSFYEVSC